MEIQKKLRCECKEIEEKRSEDLCGEIFSCVVTSVICFPFICCIYEET